MLDEVLQQKKTVLVGYQEEKISTQTKAHLSKKQRNKRKPEIVVEH